MRIWKTIAVVSALVMTPSLASAHETYATYPGNSQDDYYYDNDDGYRHSRLIPMARAVHIIQREYGGRITSITRDGKFFVLRGVAGNGHRIKARVNGRNGNIVHAKVKGYANKHYRNAIQISRLLKKLRKKGYHHFNSVKLSKWTYVVVAFNSHGNKIRLKIKAKNGKIKNVYVLSYASRHNDYSSGYGDNYGYGGGYDCGNGQPHDTRCVNDYNHDYNRDYDRDRKHKKFGYGSGLFFKIKPGIGFFLSLK